MKIGKWNCKSLCNKRVVSVLNETMQKQLIRLFAVNETQLRCCDENTYGDYTLNNSGVTYDAEQTSTGVGVIYDTTLVNMVKLIPVSERNAKAFIETAGARLKIGVAYAPTKNADEIEYVAYLKELAESTRNPDQIYYEKMLILGDLNAAIVLDPLDLNDHLPRQIGKAAASEESRWNGLLLAEFVTEHKLRV